MYSFLHIAKDISNGIPTSYHEILEDRLAIAWGVEKRQRSQHGTKSSKEVRITQRQNHARRVYLEVQDNNCYIFLPFILAHSPRSCDSIKLNHLAQLRESKPVQVDTSSETEKLIESMAIKRGLCDSSAYSTFMNAFFRNGPLQSILNEPYSKASEEGIAEIFDGCIICHTIRSEIDQSDGSTYAAVTMVFPELGLVDCLMSLGIHKSKVEFLTKALFDVELGVVGNVRYLTFPGGVKVTPNPEVTLKGVSRDTVIRVFGLKACNALEGSRMRAKELEEGNQETELVSMILTSRSDEGAVLNLSIGLKAVSNRVPGTHDGVEKDCLFAGPFGRWGLTPCDLLSRLSPKWSQRLSAGTFAYQKNRNFPSVLFNIWY